MRMARHFERGVRVSYIVLVITLLVPVLTLFHAFRAAESRDRQVAEATTAVQKAIRLEAEVNRMAADARAYLLTGNRSLSVPLHGTDALHEAVVAMRDEPPSDKAGLLLDSLARAITEYGKPRDLSIELRDGSTGAPSPELVALFENEVLPRQRAITDILGAYVTVREEEIGPLTDAAKSALQAALWASLVSVIVALVVSASLGVYSARKLVLLYTAEQAASRRAAEAVSARDEVMRVVAHDLRSPLAAISFKADMIRRSTAGAAERQAGSIVTIVRRMDSLIQSLLEMTLSQQGKLEVSLEPTDVSDILAEAYEMFEAQAAAKSISLDIQATDEHLRVQAERNRIVEVLANILENALKFTPSGGSIVIRAAPEGEMVVLSVTDSGVGIEHSELANIFEQFWKTRRGGGGTGLGLYIAHELVSAHGGRIWADSSPGRGSTLSFTLHRAR